MASVKLPLWSCTGWAQKSKNSGAEDQTLAPVRAKVGLSEDGDDNLDSVSFTGGVGTQSPRVGALTPSYTVFYKV